MRASVVVRKLSVRLALGAALALAAALLVPRAAQMVFPTAAQSSSGADIVSAAARYLGATYCWDGGDTAGPNHGAGNGNGEADDCGNQRTVGFDCSGDCRAFS